MIIHVKYYIMKYQVKLINVFNQMVHNVIEMKNGHHIQQYMVGMYKVYGQKYHLVMILMLLIEVNMVK